MRPKVSIIGQVYPWRGGISHYNAMLANELLGHADLQVVSFRRLFPQFLYPGKSQKDTESKNNFRGSAEYIIDLMNPFTWLKAARAVVKFQPRYLIFSWYTPILAPLYWILIGIIKRKTDCKAVAVVHNVLPHERRFFDKFLTTLVFKKVDIFIAHSEKDRAALKSWMPKAEAIAMFLPIFDFFYHPIPKEEARRKLGVEGNVILFFGAVRKYKGLSYLLKAMPEIVKRAGATLVIAGEFFGDKKPYLELIEKLGVSEKVKIFDRYITNEEVAGFFSAADLLVAPYISGTQSAAIATAYAFEKSVIASDVGGFGEMVEEGKTGYIVPPADSNALAKAVVDFFQNRRDFSAGIGEFKKKHSWEELGNRIVKEIILLDEK